MYYFKEKLQKFMNISEAKSILEGYLNGIKNYDTSYYQHLNKKLKNEQYKKDFILSIMTCSEAFQIALHSKVWTLENHLIVLKRLSQDEDIKSFLKIYFQHVQIADYTQDFKPGEILQKAQEITDFKKQISEFLSIN